MLLISIEIKLKNKKFKIKSLLRGFTIRFTKLESRSLPTLVF